MQQLYQWLTGWASLFRSEKSGHGTTTCTVRTEVTVQRESKTLLVAGATDLIACPLCGQPIHTAPVGGKRLRLVEGSTARDDLPADGTSP
ncbi:MAG: hypothetical protein ABSD53_22740 [Terriglobales bacterium]